MTTVFLVCDGCKVQAGPFGSYEEWENNARRLGWLFIGEDVVLCPLCAGGGA